MNNQDLLPYFLESHPQIFKKSSKVLNGRVIEMDPTELIKLILDKKEILIKILYQSGLDNLTEYLIIREEWARLTSKRCHNYYFHDKTADLSFELGPNLANDLNNIDWHTCAHYGIVKDSSVYRELYTKLQKLSNNYQERVTLHEILHEIYYYKIIYPDD